MLAQISDLHVTRPGARVCGKSDTNTFLERCVARLGALTPRPAAVLVTGDLVDEGRDDEYEHLRDLLAPLAMPVYLMVGNHDDRAALRRVFANHAYLQRDGFVNYAFDAGELRVIALDSLDPGHTGGRLCDERRAWLARELAASRDRPVVIALHHPPFSTGIPFMDTCGLARDDADALAAIVRACHNVERIVCGHVHRAITTRFAGTIASTSPSCAHQVALAFDAGTPAAFTFEPPAFMLHAYVSGAVVTHQVAIDPFEGPFPY